MKTTALAPGELAEINNFKIELNASYKNAIINFFGDQKKALRFLSAVSSAIQKNPELMGCTRPSLFGAFMSCAELGLHPSNVAGECYVIPYKTKYGLQAQFQLGVQGAITLAYRAGVNSIRAVIIYEKDDFKYTEGLNPTLYHEPVRFGEDKGAPVGVYAVAELNGTKIFKVMSEEDVMKHKAMSKAGASDFSPWNPEKDPELFMWQKTCIKQLYKFLPKNDHMKIAASAEAVDYVPDEAQNKAEKKATAGKVADTFTTPADKLNPPEDQLDKDWEPSPEEKERILAEEQKELQGKLNIAKNK